MNKALMTRRIIFALMFLGVLLPLIFKIGLPVVTTENVRNVHKLVESAKPGDKVVFSFDFDPASKPELYPMVKSLMKHCFDKQIDIVAVALWPMGVQMCDDAYKELKVDYPHIQYGKDFANLGYKTGGIVTLQKMGKDFRDIFPKDQEGTSIDELEIMNGVTNFNAFSFAVSFSAGVPGITEWVMVGHDEYKLRVAGCTTAVNAPTIMPYINEQNQLIGLLGGLKAAAEYEKLIGTPGSATQGMDAQSIAHLVIIAFIVINNINYWRNKKKEEK